MHAMMTVMVTTLRMTTMFVPTPPTHSNWTSMLTGLGMLAMRTTTTMESRTPLMTVPTTTP